MKYPFIHLHNHSEYSLLDGSTPVKDLARMAAHYEMPYLALTDHGNMFGALYFQKACLAAGIKPIIGCEVYIAPKGRLIKNADNRHFHMCLFCQNETGYKNLLKLTSQASLDGFYYKPRIDDELLEQYHEGLMASSACIGGEISRLLIADKYEEAKIRAQYYAALFGEDNYYLEVQNHGWPEEAKNRELMVRLSAETGIPLIATNDIHYLRPEDEKDNDIFICIGTQKKRSDVNRMKASPQCYFRSPQEMYELFREMPEALTNTVKLAERCDFLIQEPGPSLPEYAIPAEFTSPAAYLKKLVMDGLNGRYAQLSEAIMGRAEFELKTIDHMNFSGYFLIVWDFIDWARRQKISVGPGRGSGAGSIVAYALRITDVDPLKYNLLFERFLNPERVSMPDFDIDFNDERRDEVVAYVTQKYGQENVAGITTFGTLATKAVLKDVARVLDISFDESLKITKLIDETVLPEKDENGESVPLNVQTARIYNPDLKAIYGRGGIYAELFDVGARLEGLTRGVGTHACGKVIGKSAVVDYVPLILDQKSLSVNTAFESKVIEDCGLVKMDFLGLKTLSVIDNTIALIHKHSPAFDLSAIADDDKATFKLFTQGRTHSIFQFESEGMQKILREAKPSNMEDLIALNALYRPGPMQYIPEFIKGKNNPRSIVYFHPSLKEILQPTYGVIVYQEQVMQVAQIYAGYSLGAADLLRRAMSKKKKKEMDEQQKLFVEGAIAKGHKASDAEKLFEILLPFAGYGFNKSHAAAYSVLAYQTAYLKTHYPAEFMAANLTNDLGEPKGFSRCLSETRSMGIAIAPPTINESEEKFTVKNGTIYYGLLGLKGLGEAAVREILQTRAKVGGFNGFIDFLEKIPQNSTNKRMVDTLISAGLFDYFNGPQSRSVLLANANRAVDWAVKKKSEGQSGGGLFGLDDETAFPPFKFDEAPELTAAELLQKEKDILGFYISGHPLDDYRGAWEQHQKIDLSEPHKAQKNKVYTIVGQLKNLTIKPTKKGTLMANAMVEDFNASIAMVIFSKALESQIATERGLLSLEQFLRENGDAVLMFSGKIELERGEPQLLLDNASVPTAYPSSQPSAPPAPAKKEVSKTAPPVAPAVAAEPKPDNVAPAPVKPLPAVHLYLHDDHFGEVQVAILKEQVLRHAGAQALFFHLSNGTCIKAGSAFGVDGGRVKALEELPFVEKVE